MKHFFTYLLLIFFYLSGFQASYGQNDHHKKLEHEAKELVRAEEYIQALPLYLKLDSLIPNNAYYNYRAGICFLNSHNRAKALPYLEKASKLGYKDNDFNLYLGEAYHLNHKFDQAILCFQQYKDSSVMKPLEHHHAHKGKKKDVVDVDRFIEMCKTGKELVADSLDFVIENLGPNINTIYPEYVPAVSADEHVMIFTSRRSNSTGGELDPGDNGYYEDIYISYKDENGKWKTPENLGPTVNTPLHDANIGLSPDGHKLFIYRADFDKRNSGDIYI